MPRAFMYTYANNYECLEVGKDYETIFNLKKGGNITYILFLPNIFNLYKIMRKIKKGDFWKTNKIYLNSSKMSFNVTKDKRRWRQCSRLEKIKETEQLHFTHKTWSSQGSKKTIIKNEFGKIVEI